MVRVAPGLAVARTGENGQIAHFTCRSAFASATLPHIDISLREAAEENVSPRPHDRYHAGHACDAARGVRDASALTMEQR
jgi:hypothetical protein